MKKVFFLLLILFNSLLCFSDEPEELYSKMFDYFIDSAESDDYSGLNSFLTLYIPPGGKYEGMGTAFTGVSNDIGFFNANPSVSSRLNLSEVSFFHNNFIQDVVMETVAFTGRSNNFGFGFQGKWLHLGFSHFDGWAERNGGGVYSEFIFKNNISWNLLNGFDFSGISLGLSLNGAYRSTPNVYSELGVQNQSAFAAFIDFGVLSEFNFLKFYTSRDRNLSLGLSLLNFGREFINGPDPLPTTAAAGVSYSPLEPLTFTYDLKYQFNIHNTPTYLNDSFSEVSYGFYKGEGFYNAFGFEVLIVDEATVYGGFLLRPDNPRITLGTELSFRKNPGEEVSLEREVKESLNEWNFSIIYSLDLDPETPLNRLSVEMKINLGDYQRFEKREQVQELYVKGLQVYTNGDIEEAIKIWEKCIELDENFDPAIRMKQLAEESLNLQEKIIDKGSIE